MLARRSVLAAFTVAVTALVGQAYGAEEKSITVFAAASMRNALDEVDTLFTNHSGIKVIASYEASSALMMHIEQGASADVFLSADTEWMDYGAKRNLIKNDTRENLLGNRLVLTAPKDSKIDKVSIAPGFDLAALIGNGRIATGDVRAVPCPCDRDHSNDSAHFSLVKPGVLILPQPFHRRASLAPNSSGQSIPGEIGCRGSISKLSADAIYVLASYGCL